MLIHVSNLSLPAAYILTFTEYFLKIERKNDHEKDKREPLVFLFYLF